MDIPDIVAHRAAVNGMVTANPGELVLMHWYDMDEHAELTQLGDGIKYKYPFEVQCFAVGILTGSPLYDKPWGKHTKWILPVASFETTFVSSPKLDWHRADEYPQNLGGTYPSLESAEETGYDPERWHSIRDHRRAQIIVGQNNIHAWLDGHEQFRQCADQWFADIVRHSGAMAAA